MLQGAFAAAGERFELPPGEVEGPLRVDRPCVIEGGGTTLWAAHGPVLTVASAGVTVRNLRIEVTESGDQTAVRSEAPDVVLENVEVRGDVMGIPDEAPHWELPPVISLGDFAAEETNTFALKLHAAGTAELYCGIGGVGVHPGRLAAGEQTVGLTAAGLRDNTVLYGGLEVRTKVLRRIAVTGRAKKGALRRQEAPPVFIVEEERSVAAPEARLAPAVSGVPYMKRGQRIGFGELGGQGVLKAALEYQGFRRPLELDCYLFLLQGNQKVRGDSDLVFFGNRTASDGAVRLSDTGEVALLDLGRVESTVERIAVCWSVYGDEPEKNFSQVQEPVLRIFSGERELCRLKLENLEVKTLVAVEVYRYKGAWKLNFVGAGYRDGLRRLCESYGVEVE